MLRRNLISDSSLVHETVEMLRACGGQAAAADIADIVLKIPDLEAELAAMLIADLIKDDHRFQLSDGTIVTLECENVEARDLRAADFVVVDVETTGAKTPPCRIVEIGAYKINGARIVAEFQTLVNPEMDIPPYISHLTGITDEMVSVAPTFLEIAHAWLDFVDESVIVAHNAQFDVRFLNHEIAQVYPGRRMANSHLCTVKLSRNIFPGLLNYRLHTVAEHFAIPIIKRHRAADDALATAEIFIHMLSRLDQHGVRDVAGARRFNYQPNGNC